MAGTVHKALRSGKLRFGDWLLDCHVLADGRRVISQRAFLAMFDIHSGKLDAAHALVESFKHPALKSAAITEVIAAVTQPFVFFHKNGKTVERGYEGTLAVDYCQQLLKAHRRKLIAGPAIDAYAVAAENLILSVAKVGIIALIDEATGYQKIRDRDALQSILEKYLRDHWAKWAKRFPDEFYQEMFRLKGWQWQGMQVARPAVVGHYTNDVVYSRLAPGVLDELRKRNPVDADGKRRHKHHQWMTDDIGHPALNRHLYALLAMMRGSPDWPFFKRMVDRSFPKLGQTYLLNLGEELPPADDQ